MTSFAPKDLAPQDADGIVIRVERAAAVVENPDGTGDPVRATWGGALLASIAADPAAAPAVGDLVRWRRWPDGRVTVEAVRQRPAPRLRPLRRFVEG